MEGLDLQDSFVVLLIGSFQLPPPMHVHRVLQLILKRLDFSPLIEQFFFLEANFSFKFINAPDLRIDREILVPQGGQLQFKLVKFFGFLLAVDVPFDEVGVGQLDFLVEDGQFLISFD